MLTGLLSPDALMRVSVMLIVAFVVGAIVEQMHGYDAQIMEKNRELSEANEKLHALNVRLAEPGNDLRVQTRNYNFSMAQEGSGTCQIVRPS